MKCIQVEHKGEPMAPVYENVTNLKNGVQWFTFFFREAGDKHKWKVSIPTQSIHLYREWQE